MTNKFITQRRIATRKIHKVEWPQWVELYGFVTNIAELAVIFNINTHTLRQRLHQGWPLEAALVADLADASDQHQKRWDKNNCHQLVGLKWAKTHIKQTLTEFFTEPVAPPARQKRVYTRRSTK